MDFLHGLLATNPYFSAGAGLLGIGTALAALRQGALRYGHFVKRHFLVSLEIPSRDKSYHWVLRWLALHAQSRNNHLSVQTLFKLHDNGSSSTYFDLIPSPGVHFIKWKQRWFKVERLRERSSLDLASGSPFETVTLTTIGTSTALFMDLLQEAKRAAVSSQLGKTVIYTSWANEWRPFGQPHRKRPLSSVILDNRISESILNDVLEFNRNGKWYYDRGIPYRRGYLLYGPPGTGKSSLVKALAGELDYNICVINLAEGMMADDRLNHLLSVMPERSLLLLEDIDAAFADRSAHPNSNTKVTFSGLLNALDGVGSSEERIVFMTTNHHERLDPALLRPGRIDVQSYFGNATPHQVHQMFLQFYPGHTSLASQFAALLQSPSMSPAKIQGHFILYKNEPRKAVENVRDLFEDTK